MLEAIRHRVQAEFPDVRFAVPATMSSSVRQEYGLVGVVQNGAGLRNRLRNFFFSLGFNQGMVSRDEVDVLLDASGFGYGDYWGHEKLQKRLNDRLAGWKTDDRLAILLPQALGPFEETGMARAFRSAGENLDLIFARDAQSYAFGANALADSARDKLHRAPDFTNGLSVQLSAEYERWKGYAFVIPNEKMTLGKPQEQVDRYFRFLADALGMLETSGRRTAILLHEGANDRRLVDRLLQSVDYQKVEIVDPVTALDTKALIAEAHLIISSRFHGLVSALSAGVPAFACGWSHKYAELMQDYGVSEYNGDLADEVGLAKSLGEFLHQAENDQFRDRLKAAAAEQKKLTERMWEQCFSILRQH